LKRFALGLALVCALFIPASAGEVTNLPRPTPVVVEKSADNKVSDDVLNSTYRILVMEGLEDAWSGSGVAYDPYHVLTAAHVVDIPKGYTIWVEQFNREGVKINVFEAVVEKIDTVIDLAVIKTLEALPFSMPLVFGKASPGDPLYNVGAAYGESPTCVIWGWYGAAKAKGEDATHYSVAMIGSAPGCSGSGMWTADHKYLGVLSAGRPGQIFFVKASVVEQFLKFSK
jgi:hypothetical protein